MSGGQNTAKDKWHSGSAYERYVGRWSRLVAREFLEWLNIRAGSLWLDVGSGTGALSETILRHHNPLSVTGVDQSASFVSFARDHVSDARVRFETGDAQNLPVENSMYDAVISGLVLNFVPDQSAMAREMARAAKSGGVVAAYVWDYAEKMQLMRYFWDAVKVLHPEALDRDEVRRFPFCRPEPLTEMFQSVGLANVEVRPIDVPTHFVDFDDYWDPFLAGQGPAPGYVVTLNDHDRDALRDYIQAHLPTNADGSIHLIARAWAVKGVA